MRFTKIPLIATLMAVALSLLIVLPGIAQTGDRTDGRQGNGVISVGVFDDIADAQMAKLENSGFLVDGAALDPLAYVPVASPANSADFGTEGQHVNSIDGAGSVPSFLADRRVDPQNTFFRNTLYVSNSGEAFNTVLINVDASGVTDYGNTCVVDNTATADVDEREAGTARVTATVRNNRSGRSITLEMVRTTAGGTNSLNPARDAAAAAGDYAQAFFKIVQDGDTATPVDATNAEVTGADPVEFKEHGGPTWCDDNETTDVDTTPDVPDDALTPVQDETAATAGVYNPVQHPATAAPLATQEIATIFANHGDRLTVTTSAGSGQIELVVDGEGPDFSNISPDDGEVSRPSRLTFSFEVRDDDSGLRHDGESIISRDGDYEEINPDGDQNLSSEPLSEDPNTVVASNGPAADINVNVLANAMNDTMPTSANDISASGTWSASSSRAGVAYAFSASGADRPDDSFLYQLEATDRAGNKSTTDANPDTDASEPFVFRVDDTEPDLTRVRTGITWDSEKKEEAVDRSFIALTFNNDALGDIDTKNIEVVGHDIVGYVHPGVAPRVNRGGEKILPKPAEVDEPPTVIAEPGGTDITDGFANTAANALDGTPSLTTLVDGTLTDGETAFTAADRTGVLTTAVECDFTANPAGTTDTDDTDTNAPDNVDLAICQWTQYNAYAAANSSYVMYLEQLDQYNDENPLVDLDGNREEGVDPRSRLYIELAEDLASDAEPTVLVVGGAVYDLAGNTNESKTVSDSTTPKVEDWIAPKITVTVTGTANDRPVANEDGSFTLDVRSDEDLASRPLVYFVSVVAAPVYEDDDPGNKVTGYKYTAGQPTRPSSPLTSEEDENHWGRKYKVDGTLDGLDGLVGVIVFADDEQDNTGASAGWSPGKHQDASAPAAGNKLNVEKLDGAGLLVEVDRQFNGGDANNDNIGSVTPRSNSDGTETESSNPFVKLSFSKEKGEYDSCPTTPEDFACKDDNPSAEYKDSHSRVTITEITLNDEDAMAKLNRVDSTAYSLVLNDLEDGDYKVVFTAVDDAGNELEDGEFEFEKVAREPYEVDVSPGWNLVSLPATPLEPGISDVLASNQYISPVLGYQEGDWITAIREDGTWRGRLTEIVGGYGYWIHARTFESIETMLAEVDPAATLPTVPVTAGWNLLGVLDIFQNDMGDPPGPQVDGGFPAGNSEADGYFSSIPWRVAYSYLTSHSLWVKTVPGGDTLAPAGTDPEDAGFRSVGTDDEAKTVTEEIQNGKGYWVWSPVPGVLVP